jgi:hypothetical protein
VEAITVGHFGEPIGAYLERVAAKTSRLGQRTGLPQRVDTPLKMIFGQQASAGAIPWNGLRYQLLSGVAGTVIQAAIDQAAIGVFLIHEFLTEAVDRERRVPENEAAFVDFIKTLSRSSAIDVMSGKFYGPYEVRKSDHLVRDVKLLVGKLTYDWDNP